ncbi:diaminopimelate decarboxylase family protein [Geothrix edaphica]|uniref:Diaminopimelate decarboxylase n=1 Tax=Geothrix edaphica TaxID=2927976 RepID=A0ABQ5PZ08_9BACT|nr:alanine racemase [Geothrix edaphica]GLH67622.1 diaminopimelate decarboxylase [Geothrix edaphica]
MTALFAFDDATCQRLAEAHGTPCFAYSGAVATAGFRALRAVLPSRVRIAYAVKANPHADLLRCFAGLGASFDCASIGELERVEALGLPAGRTFFAGPGKRASELQKALSMGVRVQAEGFEDLARLDALATRETAVNLRVHPAFDIDEGNRIIGGSGPSAFGVDEEAVPALLEKAARLAHVRIKGLHVFAASNQRDAAKLRAIHGAVLDLAKRLHEAHGLAFEQIDLGGGLGVPYAPDEAPLDLAAFGQNLSDLLARHAWFEGELILEPGRFLAGPCGVYLARVVRLKESRGTRFAILEGGINHLIRPLLTGEPFPAKAVGRAGEAVPHTLAGPLCTSLDRLGEVRLPALTAGDLLAFGTTGAYGLNEGMTHFLSHPVPPEVWVD